MYTSNFNAERLHLPLLHIQTHVKGSVVDPLHVALQDREVVSLHLDIHQVVLRHLWSCSLCNKYQRLIYFYYSGISLIIHVLDFI